MLKGFTPLAAAALCLLGLSAFAQDAAAAQWVDSGRSAYFRHSAYIAAEDYTCNASAAPITGFPGTCANDAVSGWTANYNASSAEANGQRMACNHNPHQMGSTCYGVSYAINGYAYAGDLPSACSVGTRAVVYFALIETVEIEHEELDVNMVHSATEYVCQ
ncbi:hypothetical protein K4043_16960 [Stenotrophomonas sp. SRS1]|uniref:hypothetical protein n=1 Tax=Stenotrophomonas sp. SRS1 TaxID=2870345 RepID=UPI002237A152|nr:hypothetical protein [Stenotrophomonas sp. SRS1]MCW6029708.1 hypothetical protein [Stenotrophomonas sp. SRS1]